MSRQVPTSPRRHSSGRSFTLVEAVVSVVIVGVMLAAALSTVGASRLTQRKMGQRALARHLAEQLMAEILQQTYEEPVDDPVFGPEPPEAATSRELYDDLDDYHNWSASPPEGKDGTVMASLSGWKRQVSISYVQPDNFGSTTGVETGVKRIVIEVSHNNVLTATLWAIRTRNDQRTTDPLPAPI